MVELCVVLCRVSGLRVVMAKLLMQKKTTLVAGKNISTCQLATLLTDMTIPSAAFPNTTLIILDLLQEIIQVLDHFYLMNFLSCLYYRKH